MHVYRGLVVELWLLRQIPWLAAAEVGVGGHPVPADPVPADPRPTNPVLRQMAADPVLQQEVGRVARGRKGADEMGGWAARGRKGGGGLLLAGMEGNFSGGGRMSSGRLTPMGLGQARGRGAEFSGEAGLAG
jgi:hypothetical protein